MIRRRMLIHPVVYTLAALGMAGAFLAMAVNQKYITQETIFVVSKERLPVFSKDSQNTFMSYVYSDKETYVVQDSLLNGHFTSSTVYAKVRENSECDATLSGHRIGFLSWYKNIIQIDCHGV